MAGTRDLPVEILKDIRHEIRRGNGRLDALGAKVDGLGTHVDAFEEVLSRRIVESEMRTATALTDLAGTVRDLVDLLRTQSDLRPRVEQCEREIEALRVRLPDA